MSLKDRFCYFVTDAKVFVTLQIKSRNKSKATSVFLSSMSSTSRRHSIGLRAIKIIISHIPEHDASNKKLRLAPPYCQLIEKVTHWEDHIRMQRIVTLQATTSVLSVLVLEEGNKLMSCPSRAPVAPGRERHRHSRHANSRKGLKEAME